MNPVDLVFTAIPPVDASLVFGADLSVIPSRDASIDGHFDAITARVRAYQEARVGIDGVFAPISVQVLAYLGPAAQISGEFAPLTASIRITGVSQIVVRGLFEPPSGQVSGIYDNRMTRYRHASTRSLCGSAQKIRPQTAASWGLSRSARTGHDLSHQVAQRAGGGVEALLGLAAHARFSGNALWQTGDGLHLQSDLAYQTAIRLDRAPECGFETADQLQIQSAIRYQSAVRWVRLFQISWQSAIHRRCTLNLTQGASRYRTGRQFQRIPWQYARHPPTGREKTPLTPVTPVPVFSADLLFLQSWSASTKLLFRRSGDSAPIGPEQTLVVPVLRIYMVINDVSLRRIDGDMELPCLGMTLALDADSWTWSFEAVLAHTALDALEPAVSGAPVELEAHINGQRFVALLERIERSRVFGSIGLRIAGRGRMAWLDTPYAPVQSYLNSQSRTAQQLMGDVLTVNGQSLGWEVQWGLTDWLVPAGVFSHQGSYISALNRIAAAAGGYVQPDAWDSVIRVLPRYPLPPWQWDLITPDFELPVDATLQESLRWVDKPNYNRVYVSGEGAGVLAQVSRSGTAGDVLAPMVVDSLITEGVAARQRGISVLADTGRQIEVGLKLPVLPETGIIVPGAFVDYVDGSIKRRALVRSTQMQAGFPEVWQTLGVQTYA